MKIIDARKMYNDQRIMLTNRKNELLEKQSKLKELSNSAVLNDDDRKAIIGEAATLELSINELNKKIDKNRNILSQISEQYAAVWNLEAARQQCDAAKDYGEELSKILEVARRISRGDTVPATDERKLMEFDKGMYLAAKQAAVLHMAEKKKKHDSLWDDEDKSSSSAHDPQAAAENAQIAVPVPDTEE